MNMEGQGSYAKYLMGHNNNIFELHIPKGLHRSGQHISVYRYAVEEQKVVLGNRKGSEVLKSQDGEILLWLYAFFDPKNVSNLEGDTRTDSPKDCIHQDPYSSGDQVY